MTDDQAEWRAFFAEIMSHGFYEVGEQALQQNHDEMMAKFDAGTLTQPDRDYLCDHFDLPHDAVLIRAPGDGNVLIDGRVLTGRDRQP